MENDSGIENESGIENSEPKRAERRSRAFKGAKVVLTDWSSIDCIIRDVSPMGARLRFPGLTYVPTAFRVLIPTNDVLVPAERKWARGCDVGVRFTGPAKKAPPRQW